MSTGPRGEDSGFTLIELLIVLVILPVVIGAVALATITIINQTSTTDPKGVQTRLLDSDDAAALSAFYVRDIESSVAVYPGTVMSQCGSGTELLGLWLDSGIVSYSARQDPAAGWQLSRSFCSSSGGTFGPPSTTIVAHDVFSPTVAPSDISATCTGYTVIRGYGCANAASNGFVGFKIYDSSDCPASSPCASGGTTGFTASNVTRVQLYLQTYTGAYPFSLAGAPRISTASGPSATSSPPPNSVPATTTTTALPQSYQINPPFLTFGSVQVQNCTVTVNGVAGVDDTANGSVSVGSQGSFSASALYSEDTSNPSAAISPSQPGLITSAGAALPDPYAALTAPSGTTYGGYNVVTETANPWTPSGNITGAGGGTIYIVQHGIKLSGNSGITGNALLYVTGGNVDLTGNGNVTLSALSPSWENPVTSPAPPTLPEPVIWVASSNSGAAVSLGGNGNATTINGAVYAPAGQVSLNGGGNSGNLAVQGLVAQSYTCVGHDTLTAGSALSSGTSDFPSVSTLAFTPTATLTDAVTVSGVGSLTPTGTVTIYECGPSAITGCDSSTGTSVGTVALTSSGSGTATATSPSFHPPSAGSYCFAAYYGGSGSYNTSSDTTTDGCFTVSAPQVPVISQPSQGGCYTSTGAASSVCSGAVAWPGSISGTATDTGGPGLQSVQVAIQAPNGKWWNGSNFSANSISWSPATSSNSWASWQFAFPKASYPSGSAYKGTYTVQVYSTDTAGATSTAATATYGWGG